MWIVAVVALPTALLSACTNAANDTDVESASSERVMVDARGTEVTVPDEPERVITLSEPTLDAVLALDVVPVGTAAARGQTTAVAAYLAERSAGVPVVGALGQPDLEQILDLDPDLILIDGTAVNDESLTRRLAGIAPTVWTGEAGNADWRASFETVAEALGRRHEAAAYVEAYDRRVAEVGSGIDYPGAITVSVVRWGLASGSYLPTDTFPGGVLAEVGLARPESQRGGVGAHSQPVSLENIGDLDADWLFFCTLGGASNPGTADDGGGQVGVEASEKALESAVELNSGLDQLEVYRAGNVVPVDGSVWGSAGGALAAAALLEDVAATFVTP